MTKLRLAFTEFLNTQFIPNSKPHLVWLNGKYIVTWFYSKQTIINFGGEIII